ncbi:hypothetical protein B0H13DRAFT_2463472, partial [Mycena leptocephala]
SPLFFCAPTVSSTYHSYRTRTVFTLVPDLVPSVFMSYQHLGLNFGRSGHPGSAASSGTLSSGAAPTGARISINSLLNPGSSQQTQSAPSASSETRTLAQQVAQLQTQINSMNASTPQLMFSDPAEIERVRAAAAATQSLPKKILTPVVPGHKSDALTTVLSPKVEELFKKWEYCPYTALTHSSRKIMARGEDEYAAVPTSGGGLTLRTKTLNRTNETLISATDWQAAAQLAVKKIHQYWGSERASHLERHHETVTNISAMYSHEVAMEYDVRQREMLYNDPSHDISTTDMACLTLCIHEASRHSSYSSAGSNASGQRFKRPLNDEVDDVGQQRPPHSKKQRLVLNHCFRCGGTGHLPAACQAETTVAGKSCAQIITGNPRFKHNLRAQNGREYCFRFAASSKCPATASCQYFHACSVCHNRGHGANLCPQANSSADSSRASGNL